MNPKIDTKSMMATMPMFLEIDKEIDNFYKLVNEKNIEPKTLHDLERIEKFFNNTLSNIKELINKSNYSKEDKLLLKSKLTLDFHGGLSEKFNLDFNAIPAALGQYNQKIFNKALEDLQKIM